MRKEYELGRGRPNPYAHRLGAAGRDALVDRFLEAEGLVRLDDDVAAAFPSNDSVNEALRKVIELRDLVEDAPAKPRRARGRRARTK